jgi:hypothetical protein
MKNTKTLTRHAFFMLPSVSRNYQALFPLWTATRPVTCSRTIYLSTGFSRASREWLEFRHCAARTPNPYISEVTRTDQEALIICETRDFYQVKPAFQIKVFHLREMEAFHRGSSSDSRRSKIPFSILDNAEEGAYARAIHEII